MRVELKSFFTELPVKNQSKILYCLKVFEDSVLLLLQVNVKDLSLKIDPVCILSMHREQQCIIAQSRFIHIISIC